MNTLPHFSIGALALSACLLALPAQAQRPDHAGQGKGKPDQAQSARGGEGQGAKAQAKNRPDAQPRASVTVGAYFTGTQRQAARDYYGTQVRAGHCPPGLAKKNNGCLPPGQAKKWRVGQPLPRDVIFHPVPGEISVRIGLPPAGHKYVRVATDILLIAIGTGMVIDAIEDLMSL